MAAEFFDVPERDAIDRPCDTSTQVEPAGNTAFSVALRRSAGASPRTDWQSHCADASANVRRIHPSPPPSWH